jgi:hypothetical protein
MPNSCRPPNAHFAHCVSIQNALLVSRPNIAKRPHQPVTVQHSKVHSPTVQMRPLNHPYIWYVGHISHWAGQQCHCVNTPACRVLSGQCEC